MQRKTEGLGQIYTRVMLCGQHIKLDYDKHKRTITCQLKPIISIRLQLQVNTCHRRGSSPKFDLVLLNLKKFWSPQSEKILFQPARGGQKSLKIGALKSPETAFQSNLLGNFFTITLVIFSYETSYFYY